MVQFKNINYTDEEIRSIVNESRSMREAIVKTGIPATTFKRKATQLGIYKPNQGHKGYGIKYKWNKENLLDVLEKGSQKFQSYGLKNLLLRTGVFENKCMSCGISQWNSRPLQIQLHHKDGNKNNNKLENLMMLCPNCHSQTDTYTSRNLSKNKVRKLY